MDIDELHAFYEREDAMRSSSGNSHGDEDAALPKA